jgi:hypothetical protein
MYNSDIYVKSEMDYRAEVIRRSMPVRRRSRRRLVRRRTPEIDTTN